MGCKIFSLGDAIKSKDTRLFLGDDSCNVNIQTFHAPRFPWILDFAEQLRTVGNWSKFEIDLSKEKTDYDELSDNLKHIYESGLKFAICLDSCAGRAPLQLLVEGGLSNCPEWELYVTNHQNNELLHSESYTEMIRAIYNDVDDFVDSIMNDEYIQKRAKTILSAFDEATLVFDKMNANTTSRTVDPDKDIPYPEITRGVVKKAIYKSLMVINMFEGIRFFCTFATNWSFSEQPEKLMQGSSNMFKLIARDEMIHLDIIQKVILLLRTDKKEEFVSITEEMDDEIYKMYEDAFAEEMDWIEYLFKDGSQLIGMNEKILKNYMEYIFYVRLSNIGMDPSRINLKKIDNPLPWLDNYLDSTNVKTAPQEMESVSYIAAIDVTKDEDFDFDDI